MDERSNIYNDETYETVSRKYASQFLYCMITKKDNHKMATKTFINKTTQMSLWCHEGLNV